MRSAMRILESEGLIRIQRGVHGGPRVLPLDVEVLARQAAVYLQVEGADLTALLEALKILEPGAVALAARRRTEDQLSELYSCADRAAESAAMSGFSDASADFVLLLLQASGSAAIKLFGTVIAHLVRTELHRELDDKPVTDANRWNAQRFREVASPDRARRGRSRRCTLEISYYQHRSQRDAKGGSQIHATTAPPTGPGA